MTASSRGMNLKGSGIYDTYRYCWGDIPPETVYRDVCGFQSPENTDLRPALKSRHVAHLKALQTTSGGVGTAGQALVPVFVDPTIVDQERRETPMREITPRVTNLGITADWNERTA